MVQKLRNAPMPEFVTNRINKLGIPITKSSPFFFAWWKPFCKTRWISFRIILIKITEALPKHISDTIDRSRQIIKFLLHRNATNTKKKKTNKPIAPKRSKFYIQWITKFVLLILFSICFVVCWIFIFRTRGPDMPQQNKDCIWNSDSALKHSYHVLFAENSKAVMNTMSYSIYHFDYCDRTKTIADLVYKFLSYSYFWLISLLVWQGLFGIFYFGSEGYIQISQCWIHSQSNHEPFLKNNFLCSSLEL